jgi:hypothetical protein
MSRPIWFYFELDADGTVLRQVELKESGVEPLAAASLAEWQDAKDAGAMAEYEAMYGVTAELPFPEWEGHDPQWLSAQEFKTVWAAARQQIHARRR